MPAAAWWPFPGGAVLLRDCHVTGAMRAGKCWALSFPGQPGRAACAVCPPTQSGFQAVQRFGDLAASAPGRLLPLDQQRLQQHAHSHVPFGQFLAAALLLPDGPGSSLKIMRRREAELLGQMRADRPGQSGQACQDTAALPSDGAGPAVLGCGCAPPRGSRRQPGPLGGQSGLCARQLGSAGGDRLVQLRDPAAGLAEQSVQRHVPAQPQQPRKQGLFIGKTSRRHCPESYGLCSCGFCTLRTGTWAAGSTEKT